MFTIEDLRKNAKLAGLTDEQCNEIIALGTNSEQAAVDKRTGELHGQYDTDILALSGVAKIGTEKSYDYVKRVMGDYKTKLEAAEAKVTELNKKIAEGSQDETLKKQLEDTKSLVSQLRKQVTDKETELTNEKANNAKAMLDMQIDNAFSIATSGIKFKAGITEPIQKALLQTAKAEVMARGKFEMTDQDGKKVLIVRDANNEILRNKNNNFNPYTIAELFAETSIKDAIDNGRQQGGGGTHEGSGGGGSTTLDMSNAHSQIEADRIIESYLLQKGLTRDSEEFATQSMQLRTDNKVAELPIR